MARREARVRMSIWDDEDFTPLPLVAQHLYVLLFTQPHLSWCGVTPWVPVRWSRLSADGASTTTTTRRSTTTTTRAPTTTLTPAAWAAAHGTNITLVISTASGLVTAIDRGDATAISRSCSALTNNYRRLLQPIPAPPEAAAAKLSDQAKTEIYNAQRHCSGGIIRSADLATAATEARTGAGPGAHRNRRIKQLAPILNRLMMAYWVPAYDGGGTGGGCLLLPPNRHTSDPSGGASCPSLSHAPMPSTISRCPSC